MSSSVALAKRRQSAILAGVLLLVVCVLDLLRAQLTMRLLLDGVTDELAHLATAGVVLIAAVTVCRARPDRHFVLAALVMSVGLDADHLLLYADVPHVAAGGRPYSHSLSVVAALAAASVLTGPRATVLRGCAVGVLLHLLRDLGTGPGVPLLWPVTAESLRAPYEGYSAVLITLTLVVALGVARRTPRPSGRVTPPGRAGEGQPVEPASVDASDPSPDDATG